MRPWSLLFQRPWYSKESEEIEKSLEIDWVYSVAARSTIDKLALKQTCELSEPVFCLSQIMCVATTQLKTTEDMKDLRVIPTLGIVDGEVTVDNPVLNTWTCIGDKLAYVHWLHEITKTWKQPKHEPHKEVNKPLNLDWTKNLRLSLVITGVTILAEAIDPGIKGTGEKRPGYIDTRPEKDVLISFWGSIERFSVSFKGAHVFGHSKRSSHRYNLSSGSINMTSDPSQEGTMKRLGSLKASIQNACIRREFRPENGPRSLSPENSKLLGWLSRANGRVDLHTESGVVYARSDVVIKKIGAHYSLENHFASLMFLQAIRKIQEILKKPQATQPTHTAHTVSQKLFKIQRIQCQLNRTDFHIHLPKNTPLYLRIDGLKTQWQDTQLMGPIMVIRNLMIFGMGVNDSGRWDQLLEADNLDITLQNGMVNPSDGHQLKLSKLYLRIPYQFVMADIVDNALNMVKAIKTLRLRFKYGEPLTFFGPKISPNPLGIPRMSIVCDNFTLELEDDPFEARLRKIWRTGVLEQTSRLALEDAFEAKVQSVTQTSDNPETDARVSEALHGLQHHNANSWIKKVNFLIQKETMAYDKSRQSNYRNPTSEAYDEMYDELDNSTSKIPSLFHIHTIPLPRSPPLLNITVLKTACKFSQPSFPLEDTRQFVHKNGKGIPLDTQFSTLVPFHVDWSAGKTWIQIRDYPIPLMHVPPPTTIDDSTPAWLLSGDYVFGDELGSIEATRSINVLIVDQENINYNFNVARTSTPPKFYSIVDIKVFTQSMTSFCWSTSYQPAIQDITGALDNLTRPPIDPSPKVGFWDKLRLMIHTQCKLGFVGGGDVACVMKGTRNPYDMSDRGFGMSMVWRKQVEWYIGHDNPQGEFMQLLSRDYALGVPDLLRGGYAFLNLLPEGQPQYEASILSSGASSSGTSSRQGRPSAWSDSREPSLNTSEDEKELRFSKILLKLSGGICMGIGCHLERVCSPNLDGCGCQGNAMEDRKCRLLHFLPHYNVKFMTPSAVEKLGDSDNYDAYAGFRSHFIHFSISIVKLKIEEDKEADLDVVSMNSMHLTPNTLDHFGAWFRLFGGAMNYPTRSGTLYPKLDVRPTKKFSKHMSTMKYKIMVGPLMIGYFYKDENEPGSSLSVDDLGDCVGLKALVSSFNVDMHQRREVVHQTGLNVDNKQLKANWPLHEAEVQLKNVDMRAVRASYRKKQPMEDIIGESGLPSSTIDTSSVFSSDSSRADCFEDWDEKSNEDSTPPEWVDLDDFVELHMPTPKVEPKVQVLPFAFSPYLYYLKQNNRDDVEKYRYLHKTHDCILGTAVETREVQMSLLQERSDNIDLQIRKHQARLHNVESRLSGRSDDNDLLNESRAIVEKTEMLFEKRGILQRYLRELSTESMPNVAHNGHTDTAAYSSSMIFGHDSLMKWENLMGYFRQRYIVHNAQILWNNSIRNIIYHLLDVQAHKRALTYYMSARAVKFLRDMNETHRQNQRNEMGGSEENESNSGIQMAQELIEKLLADQKNIYAANETEGTSKDTRRGSGFSETSNKNVNDPEAHINSIPSGYLMKSGYLIDLLNPQISLQSDANPDSLVLMSNQRMQVKGFNIVDASESEADMELVKDRTIVSIDNAQFFVAKKEQFETVDLLLDNHYGAKDNEHWLTWIPSEMLINYVKLSDKFQRVGTKLTATIQYDKYNPLRMKAKLYSSITQIHPFEDRCDTVLLNFPKLALTANSQQYNAMYEVAVDLLLYKEPAKKERLARLREIMMAADRGDPCEITRKIENLQNRIRRLTKTRDHYRQKVAYLDESQMDKFQDIRTTLYELREELFLGMEAIKITQTSKRSNDHEPITNLKFVFSAEKVIWEMLTDNDTPLSEWNLTNTTFILINREDHSSTNTLEVDLLHVTNRTIPPVFTDIIGPYADPRKVHDFSRHKMIRCYISSLAPVGGIPVIQHLEINLSPVKVQMTYDFGKAMASYIFPPERRIKQPDTVGTISLSPSSQNLAEMENGSGENESIQNLDTKSVDKDSLRNASNTKFLDSGKNTGADSIKTVDISYMPKDNGDLDTPDTSSTVSAPPTTGKKGKKINKSKLDRKGATDDLTVMKNRASNNRAFILVKIPGAKHCLSYQGPKEKNIEDLRDFVFQQPNLEYRNKTWSWFELMSNIKKDFMRAALLNNSPALIKEKLTIRRHPRDSTKNIDTTSSIQSSSSIIEESGFCDSQMKPQGLYEGDDLLELTESSREEEEHELDKDAVSLHSSNSQEAGWEAEAPTDTKTARRVLPWARRFRKTKTSVNPTETVEPLQHDIPVRVEDDLGCQKGTANHRRSIGGINIPPRCEKNIAPAPNDEELASKGRMLLGKYYSGPSHTHTMSKFKGKLSHKPSSVKSSCSAGKGL
ncbi:golgi-body localization protein domain-containing protein [Phycomyces blakesleeanus]